MDNVYFFVNFNLMKSEFPLSRLTLLLGPPSSGKTTLLLALAGRLDHALKVITIINFCIAKSQVLVVNVVFLNVVVQF